MSGAEFTRFCGEELGLPLEPFQRKIVGAITASAETVVLLPRGNGKTTLLAALALHHLLTVDRPAVYVAAASREQARVLFEAARDFALRLDHPHLAVRHLELRYLTDPEAPKHPSGHLRVLAADARLLHGLTPTLAIVDELQAHRDGELYIALRSAMHKRPGAKMITISTAGHGADSPLGQLRARALAQPTVKRTGALTDCRGPDLRMLEWAVPEDADPADLAWAAKANPASWITRAALRAQRDALPALAWQRYHLDRWTAVEGAWLPAGAWQACADPHLAVEDGEPLWVGVDVGGDRSATAVIAVTADLRVIPHVFHGERGILDAIDQIHDLAAHHPLREVIYDPWRFAQAALELEQRGIPVVQFPQTDARMVPASASLHAAVTERRLTHPDDPELNAHVFHAVAKHSRRGWRLDKATRGDNIDGAVALAMAVERAQQPVPQLQVVGWL